MQQAAMLGAAPPPSPSLPLPPRPLPNRSGASGTSASGRCDLQRDRAANDVRSATETFRALRTPLGRQPAHPPTTPTIPQSPTVRCSECARRGLPFADRGDGPYGSKR